MSYDENDRWQCHHCKSGREAQERSSFGAYAGKYCDACWANSGFRDARDPSAKFDRDDAGETIECETVEEDREWAS